nr:immunoglobulin heavy chain junction region [Mus musculus]
LCKKEDRQLRLRGFGLL